MTDDTTAPDAGHTNLFVALLAFQQEMPTVPKTKTARVPTKGGGSYSYSYADLAVVASVATPLLAKHGLMFVSTPGVANVGHPGYELVGRVVHAATGEQLTGSLPLFGTSSQDIGGSITYMRRYLMGCLTGLITDEDTDASVLPGARAKQEPTTDPITREQFYAIKDYGQSGYDVDGLLQRKWNGNVDANNITREQAHELLTELETMRPE